MIYSDRDVAQIHNIPESEWLLGFNEPNMADQANMMTPEYAASLWPQLEASGRKLVSPAMAMENGLQWMDSFIAACHGCRVDAIAIHLYEGSVGGVKYWVDQFAKYGKPIWITEIAQPSKSEQQCAQFAKDVVRYMEGDSRIERYAWFMNRGDFGSLSHCSAFHDDGNIT